MKHIYSKDIVSARKARLVEAFGAVKRRGIAPKLAAVICAADPAVASYVSVKKKHTEEVGGSFEIVDLSAAGACADVASGMKALCVRPDVHGVILVMSSKPKFDEIELTNLIPANKDVDGLSAANLGALVQNDPRQFFMAPATPRACIVLAESRDRIEGKTRRCDRQRAHGRKAAREHADQRRRDGHRLSLLEQGYSANRAIG